MGAEKSSFEINGQKFSYFKEGYETFKTLQEDFPDEFLHAEGRLVKDSADYVDGVLSAKIEELKKWGSNYLDLIKKIDKDKSWLAAQLKKEPGPDPDNPISDQKCERGHLIILSQISPNHLKGDVRCTNCQRWVKVVDGIWRCVDKCKSDWCVNCGIISLNMHKIKARFDKYYWRRKIQATDAYKVESNQSLYVDKVKNERNQKFYSRKEYRTFLIGAQMELELRAQQCVRHPFIFPLYQVFKGEERYGDLHFVTQEWEESGTMQDFIKMRKYRGVPCTVIELVQIFTQIGLALEAIHQQGLLHRNISSAHVYVTLEKSVDRDHFFSNVRLGGLSSHTYQTAVEKFDKMHHYCLENFYLSPEVVNGAEYGQEADLWALGVLFLEIASFCDKPVYSPYTYTKEFGEPIQVDVLKKCQQKIKMYPQYIQNVINSLLSTDIRPTSLQLLSLVGLNNKTNHLIRSTEFKKKFKEGVKKRCGFGYASEIEQQQLQELRGCCKEDESFFQAVYERYVDRFNIRSMRADGEYKHKCQQILQGKDFAFYAQQMQEEIEPFFLDKIQLKNLGEIEDVEEDFDRFSSFVHSTVNQVASPKGKTARASVIPKNLSIIGQLEQELQKNPKHKETLLAMAKEVLKNSQYSRCGELVERVLSFEPRNLAAQKMLAEVHFAMDKFEDCHSDLLKIVEIESYIQTGVQLTGEKLQKLLVSQSESIFQAGKVQLKMGQIDECFNSFIDCLKHNSCHYGASIHLASLMLAADKNKQAALLYKNAQETKSQSPSAHYGLIIAVQHNGYMVEKHLEKSLLRDPENFVLMTQLAILYLLQYKDLQAAHLLDKALKYNKHYGPAIVVMADLFRFSGFSKEAQTFYQLGQKIDPKQTWTLKGAAMAYNDSGDFEDAYQSFKKAYELDKSLGSNENDHIQNTFQQFKIQMAISMRHIGKHNRAFSLFADAWRTDASFLKARWCLLPVKFDILDRIIAGMHEKQERFEEDFLIMFIAQICSQLTSDESCAKFTMQIPPEEGKKQRLKHFELVFSPHMQSMGIVLCAMSNLQSIQVLFDETVKGNVPFASAYYSNRLQKIVNDLLNNDEIKYKTILKSSIIKQFQERQEYQEHREKCQKQQNPEPLPQEIMDDSDAEEENRVLRAEVTVGWRLELQNDFYRKQKLIENHNYGEQIEVIRVKDGKIFHAKRQTEREFYRDARDEVELMDKLVHENIVGLVDCFQGKKQQQMVTIYENNNFENIEKQIEYWKPKSDNLPEDFVLFCFEQLLRALNFSQEQNIFHGDLRPDNLLLYNNEQVIVKMSDFGLKKDLTTKGTRFYLSPEECSGGKIDGKSDVFSLGCILCEMLTGKKVWMQGNDSTDVENKVDGIKNRILTQAPDRLPDHISQKLKYSIYLMLQKSPENRPSVLDLLKTDLFKKAGYKDAFEMCESLPKNIQIPTYQTCVKQTFLTSDQDDEIEKYIDPSDEEAISQSKQKKLKKYLKQTPVFILGGEFENIKKGMFAPSIEQLAAMSASKLDEHHLLELRYGVRQHGWPAYWTFVFHDDIHSPPQLTYLVEPKESKEIPAEKDCASFHFRNCGLYLYSIQIYDALGNMVFEVMPEDQTAIHYSTDIIELMPGERVVSVNLNLNEEKQVPVKVELLIYNAV